MSCNVCQAKFTFFTKEVACPSCGFSYCNKCLKYKHNIPGVGVKKVCGRCYNKRNSMDKPSPDYDADMHDANKEPLPPVDIEKKWVKCNKRLKDTLNSLENPTKPPIVMYTHTNHWDRLKKGLDPEDQEIVDRLRKLKEEDKNKPLPSVDDIRRRLALLKDEDPDANGSNHRINIHEVDTRTDQQKTDDLIQEYLEQLELASANDPAAEIESKLRKLQGQENKPDTSKQREDFEDDEHHVTKRLIKKALAEAALERKYEEDVDELEEMDVEAARHSEDEDEKPSCVICDQTEDLERCTGCSGDLYCSLCFEDNHDDFEMSKHKRVPVKKASLD